MPRGQGRGRLPECQETQSKKGCSIVAIENFPCVSTCVECKCQRSICACIKNVAKYPTAFYSASTTEQRGAGAPGGHPRSRCSAHKPKVPGTLVCKHSGHCWDAKSNACVRTCSFTTHKRASRHQDRWVSEKFPLDQQGAPKRLCTRVTAVPSPVHQGAPKRRWTEGTTTRGEFSGLGLRRANQASSTTRQVSKASGPAPYQTASVCTGYTERQLHDWTLSLSAISHRTSSDPVSPQGGRNGRVARSRDDAIGSRSNERRSVGSRVDASCSHSNARVACRDGDVSSRDDAISFYSNQRRSVESRVDASCSHSNVRFACGDGDVSSPSPPAHSLSREMESLQSQPVGASHYTERLQTAIFNKAPHVRQCAIFTRNWSGCCDSEGRGLLTTEQRGHQGNTSSSETSRFLFEVFPGEKERGGARPILDLRGLNKHLKSFKFRMLTTAALLRMVRRGDWWTSVDLTDAYFHIPIYPPHRKFLRFGFEGRVYEYTVLPFGMALSPRVFVKCTQAAIAPLRQQGIRLATYIDDWLISADTSQKVERDTAVVISHLTSLGFTINFRKSVLVPSQQTTFIGVSLDSTTLTARLSQDRIDSFLACVRSFHTGQRVTYRQCMQATGLMASAIHLIRLGRFHMRPFQRWVRSLRIPPTGGSRKVWVSPRCVDTLKPWLDAAFLSKGVRIGAVISRKIVTTDASLTGWGAVHAGRSASGVWGPDLQTAHINYLELMAVFLALKHFEALIHGCHVVIRTDNTTTMCYVNKQGGLASPLLDDLARELTLWCDTRLASVRAVHVPGLQNSGADLLSRGRFWYEDWSLHPVVARQIWARFGRPEVDLFASEENAKCSLFFSVKGTPPLGLDALSHSWPDKLLYAFPPLGLIRPTLERIRLHGLTLLLLAPAWGSWRSEIAPLLYDNPWPLPPHRDLLRQAGDEIFHPDPRALDLWVWPVRGRR